MNETIQLDETTRIRHMDAKNWTVEVLKECKTKDGEPYTAWKQANGDGFGPFLRTPTQAVTWLLDYDFGGSGFQGDLKRAVAEFQRIADDLKRAVEKAVGR